MSLTRSRGRAGRLRGNGPAADSPFPDHGMRHAENGARGFLEITE